MVLPKRIGLQSFKRDHWNMFNFNIDTFVCVWTGKMHIFSYKEIPTTFGYVEHGHAIYKKVWYIHTGADPENFSRGGPTLMYYYGSAQIWKITFFSFPVI